MVTVYQAMRRLRQCAERQYCVRISAFLPRLVVGCSVALIWYLFKYGSALALGARQVGAAVLLDVLDDHPGNILAGGGFDAFQAWR